LRRLGFKHITLKTGAYSLRELAMAIKWSSRARIDLLTIDGSGGGTGMSPWRMMEEWGIPSLYLHSAAYEFSQRLANRGERVPDIAFAGGFSSEDGIFKALALGEPEGLVKTVFDAGTGELLGAHMIGAEVTEMIQGYAIGRTLETTEAELMATVFPHPTISEAMHESVLDAWGRAVHF